MNNAHDQSPQFLDRMDLSPSLRSRQPVREGDTRGHLAVGHVLSHGNALADSLLKATYVRAKERLRHDTEREFHHLAGYIILPTRFPTVDKFAGVGGHKVSVSLDSFGVEAG